MSGPRYQWKTDSNQWVDYPADLSGQISAAFHRGEPTTEIDIPGRGAYIIDFSSQTQIQKNNAHKWRRIRLFDASRNSSSNLSSSSSQTSHRSQNSSKRGSNTPGNDYIIVDTYPTYSFVTSFETFGIVPDPSSGFMLTPVFKLPATHPTHPSQNAIKYPMEGRDEVFAWQDKGPYPQSLNFTIIHGRPGVAPPQAHVPVPIHANSNPYPQHTNNLEHSVGNNFSGAAAPLYASTPGQTGGGNYIKPVGSSVYGSAQYSPVSPTGYGVGQLGAHSGYAATLPNGTTGNSNINNNLGSNVQFAGSNSRATGSGYPNGFGAPPQQQHGASIPPPAYDANEAQAFQRSQLGFGGGSTSANPDLLRFDGFGGRGLGGLGGLGGSQGHVAPIGGGGFGVPSQFAGQPFAPSQGGNNYTNQQGVGAQLEEPSMNIRPEAKHAAFQQQQPPYSGYQNMALGASYQQFPPPNLDTLEPHPHSLAD